MEAIGSGNRRVARRRPAPHVTRSGSDDRDIVLLLPPQSVIEIGVPELFELGPDMLASEAVPC
jgi:hypothetical protein